MIHFYYIDASSNEFHKYETFLKLENFNSTKRALRSVITSTTIKLGKQYNNSVL